MIWLVLLLLLQSPFVHHGQQNIRQQYNNCGYAEIVAVDVWNGLVETDGRWSVNTHRTLPVAAWDEFAAQPGVVFWLGYGQFNDDGQEGFDWPLDHTLQAVIILTTAQRTHRVLVYTSRLVPEAVYLVGMKEHDPPHGCFALRYSDVALAILN